jgi:hypothetical protein
MASYYNYPDIPDYDSDEEEDCYNPRKPSRHENRNWVFHKEEGHNCGHCGLDFECRSKRGDRSLFCQCIQAYLPPGKLRSELEKRNPKTAKKYAKWNRICRGCAIAAEHTNSFQFSLYDHIFFSNM